MKKFKVLFMMLVIFNGIMEIRAEDYNQNLIKGMDAGSKGDFKEAFNYYKQGALEGDKYCCGRLATLYLNGIGIDANISEGRKWAIKGYELGNSFSAAMLGYSYIFEYGMDNVEALKKATPYFEYAYNAEDREFDNADLYANIGLFIASNKMMLGNTTEGLAWIDRAIEDFPTFLPLLGQAAMIYWSMENYTKAVKYATLADKDDNIQGSFVLGWCMAHGKGIEMNAEAGFKKIRKSANIGTPDYALFALGECYYNGIGTPVNKQLAKEWFQKAADAGIEEASEKLNILF